MNKNKIVYVGGYGRSGSTLLCAVLGGSGQAVPVGELKAIFAYYHQARICSCGENLEACEYWGEIVQEFLSENPDITLDEASRVTETIENYNNWLTLRYRNTEEEKKYQRIWQSIIDIVCAKSGCNYIIDASKSSTIACNRAAALAGFVDVELIHLVRDPRAVMASMLSAQKRRMQKHGIRPVAFRGLRTLVSWSFTNIYIHMISFFGIKKVKARVSYEELTNNPKKTIELIDQAVDIDCSHVIENIEKSIPFDAGHIFSGDLLRMKGEYQISAFSPKWRNQLNGIQHGMVWLTYPIARYYGFLKITRR